MQKFSMRLETSRLVYARDTPCSATLNFVGLSSGSCGRFHYAALWPWHLTFDLKSSPLVTRDTRHLLINFKLSSSFHSLFMDRHGTDRQTDRQTYVVQCVTRPLTA